MEDYVSFEVAKLLKEKGFDEPVYRFYDSDGVVCEKHIEPQQKCKEWQFPCPTLQSAMKWLRKRKAIFIIEYGNVGNPEEPKMQWWWQKVDESGALDECNITDGLMSYEEAVESALKYYCETQIG